MKHKLYKLTAALLLALLLVGAASAAGGDGTAENPYIIQTPAELQSMQNDLSAYYVLANDIDMSGISNWTPIGSSNNPVTTAFHGCLDGNGHTIRNLNIDLPSTQYVGLFAVITAGTTIKNLKFADCTISGAANTGTLYGRCYGISGVSTPFTITDVDLTDCSITASSSYSGGLGGAGAFEAVGTISYCDVKNCTVTSTSSTVGGLLGSGSISGGSECTVTNCEVGYCYVTSASYAVGGLLGYGSYSGGYSEIESNHVHDCVMAASYNVGGLLGYGSSSSGSECYVRENAVENCVMAANSVVGGLLGFGSNSGGLTEIDGNAVENCTVKARNSHAGGIAGCNYAAGSGNITDCTVSNTTVQASSFAGGICSTFVRA